MQGAYKAINLESLSSINKTILDVDEISIEFDPVEGLDLEFYRIVDGVVQVKSQAEIDSIRIARISAITADQTAFVNARIKMKNLPGWSTWTDEDVDNWVAANIPNVTDLASAKNAIDGIRTAIRAMGKAIIYLRDYVRITG